MTIIIHPEDLHNPKKKHVNLDDIIKAGSVKNMVEEGDVVLLKRNIDGVNEDKVLFGPFTD